MLRVTLGLYYFVPIYLHNLAYRFNDETVQFTVVHLNWSLLTTHREAMPFTIPPRVLLTALEHFARAIKQNILADHSLLPMAVVSGCCIAQV
jgi:hypothetical protein